MGPGGGGGKLMNRHPGCVRALLDFTGKLGSEAVLCEIAMLFCIA